MKDKFGLVKSSVCDRKCLINEIAVVLLLLAAFLFEIQILILIAFLICCYFIIVSPYAKATHYLAFFTSFAGILVFRGRHMYFVLAALLIIRSFFSQRVPPMAILYYFVILVYSMLFCDMDADLSFANFIGIILMFLIPIIISNSHEIGIETFCGHYVFGFSLSTVLGYVVMNIPTMRELFSYDLYWTADYIELFRFFGLAFDSNFYALSNYTVIAYLLFVDKHRSKMKAALIIFLLISGLQTISKSYFLVVTVILMVYMLKNAKDVKKTGRIMAVFFLGIAAILLFSNKMGYNLVDLILKRFDRNAGFAANTTGRFDIWMMYLDKLVNADLKKFLFGFGFNTPIELAAHNTFMELLYSFGLIGIGIWIFYVLHCMALYYNRNNCVQHCSIMPLASVVAGISFLSAFTYESLWINLLIGFISLGRCSGKEEK